MKLLLLRFSSQEDSTLGMLFKVNSRYKEFLCFTIEDEHRDVKVKGETRIPAGRYNITLRTVGGYDERYKKRFGRMHRGMLWLQDVPGFEYILIHCGNTDDDTAGCILIGDASHENVTGDGVIQGSMLAYKRVYPELAEAADRNSLYIEVVDYA